MSRLVKSHLFPQFIQLNREIGTGRGHWGDRRVWGCQSRAGGRALHSGATWGGGSRVHHATDGKSIGSEVAAAVSHNCDSQ